MGVPSQPRGERRRRSLPVLLSLCLVASAAVAAPRLEWKHDPDHPCDAWVEAAGLAGLQAAREEAAAILSVRVLPAADQAGLPAMAGTHAIDADRLVFHPRFPLEPGLPYQAVLTLRTAAGPSTLEATYTPPPRPAAAPTTITTITPSSDLLPLNLLKFYLTFSAPMTRGSAYRHIILREQDGKRVEDPFLELPEELWDPGMTRLTILLDPGRIKRGLLPNETVGAVLQDGHHYVLTIDPSWKDAAGQALAARTEKKFRAGPADYTQPDPATWSYHYPAADSRQPLRITFPESLDAALLARLLTIRDASGQPVAGQLALSNHERAWSFTPDQPWPDTPCHLRIDHRLEDLAGNSIERRFEEALDQHPGQAGAPPGHRIHSFTPKPVQPAE